MLTPDQNLINYIHSSRSKCNFLPTARWRCQACNQAGGFHQAGDEGDTERFTRRHKFNQKGERFFRNNDIYRGEFDKIRYLMIIT